jgi:hypothetical protein
MPRMKYFVGDTLFHNEYSLKCKIVFGMIYTCNIETKLISHLDNNNLYKTLQCNSIQCITLKML